MLAADDVRPPGGFTTVSESTAAAQAAGAGASDAGAGGSGDDSAVSWRRALAVGLATYVVSRFAVAAGAGVRASQQVVDANQAGQQRPGSALDLITQVSTSWDGLWYLEIIRNGYPRSIPENVTYFQEEARAAFFPVYPIIARTVDAVLPGGDTLAALTTNLVLGAVAVMLVGLLARRIFDTSTAMYSMMLFSVFPGSFVMSFAYAETVLIVFAALCLLFLIDERWLLAGLAAALATATRPNGLAVVAACLVAAVIAIRRRRDWGALVAVALSPLGFIAFQLYLMVHTDERLPWFRVQSQAWDEGTSFGLTAITHIIDFVRAPLASPTDAITTITVLALIAALWITWKQPLPPPALAYSLVIVALMLLPDTVTARPRFLFTAFPLFIAVAAWLPRRERAVWEIVLIIGGAGLAALTTLYGVFGAIP